MVFYPSNKEWGSSNALAVFSISLLPRMTNQLPGSMWRHYKALMQTVAFSAATDRGAKAVSGELNLCRFVMKEQPSGAKDAADKLVQSSQLSERLPAGDTAPVSSRPAPL